MLPFVLLAPACAGVRTADPPLLEFEARGTRWIIECLDLMRWHGEETPARVRVSVMKNDPEAGWVEWSGVYRAGQWLGWDHGALSARSHHRVFSGRLIRYVTVDFDTGWMVKQVIVDKPGPGLERACTTAKWPAPAQCLGPTLQPILENGIVIEDKAGERREFFQKQVSLLAERLCRDHGGFQKPLMWTRAQAQGQREANAHYWLCQADWEWRSTSSEALLRGREIYRMLMNTYSSEKAVRESFDRIKSRAESRIGD